MGGAKEIFPQRDRIGADIMIFVTVGTHEQPFDRLVEAVDGLKEKGFLSGDVFIQTGYSSYRPRFCDFSDFIGFSEMIERMQTADVVITHGGTGSIMLVLYNGKIPVVLPRQKKYNEHIDDHQVRFCEKMELKGKILAVYETEDLESTIGNYKDRVETLLKQGEGPTAAQLDERAGCFARKLEEICLQLVKK